MNELLSESTNVFPSASSSMFAESAPLTSWMCLQVLADGFGLSHQEASSWICYE